MTTTPSEHAAREAASREAAASLAGVETAARSVTAAAEPATGITGAQSLVRSLEAVGVEVIFGIPGGAILPAYDPLFDSAVRHVLVRHEQGAGHAATGYAQATGKVGVCMATSGPGRDEPGHPPGRRAHGLRADRGDHRPGAQRRDRHRRLPGSRHPRHHDAGDQAQLPGHQRRRDPAADRRGLPPGQHRPPRPVLVDIPKDVLQAQDRLRLAAADGPARLQADHPAARQAGPRGGGADRRRAPSGALRRRWRPEGRRPVRSWPSWPS